MVSKSKESTVRHVTASDFRAKCPGILREVEATRAPVTVTRRGKPIAVITPAPPTLFGIARGTISFASDDDLLSTGAEWDAQA